MDEGVHLFDLFHRAVFDPAGRGSQVLFHLPGNGSVLFQFAAGVFDLLVQLFLPLFGGLLQLLNLLVHCLSGLLDFGAVLITDRLE